jgi:hypothetical protein
MAQDEFQRIKERFADATDLFSEQRSRMVEDLRFSDPTNPQQWDAKMRTAREAQAMPCYTFDQTNQYIAQVVNDSRMNKPQIQTVPASSGSDQKVSDVLDGMIRQIEYASDAPIAYDIAQEAGARTGRGWMRLITEVCDPAYNLQELRIRPVVDSLSIIPGDYILPTGEDMRFCFVESRMSKDAYDSKYGKKRGKTPSAWKSDAGGWFDDKDMRIAEYFEVIDEKVNTLLIRGPDGSTMSVPESDYWELARQIGFKPQVVSTYEVTNTRVEWRKLNGDDFIEDKTEFPGKFIPCVPVHGYEIWIEGKRFLCGMPRRMRDAQQSYNMERSAEIQVKALQPKAPYLIAFESVEGHVDAWSRANTDNQAYIPYNAIDAEGRPLPVPSRIAPPQIGTAFIQGSQQAISDLQASVGMYRANLGAPSNETSGIAIKRREQQGDTANFHFIDNLARSMGHLGRIIVGAIPVVYADSAYGPRDVRTLGIEGTSSRVIIDPSLEQGHVQAKDGTIRINPTTGNYDVRVKVGPAYANLREELSARLSEMSRGNPQLGAALAPLLTQMMDMPESEKVSKICLALLPPQVQQAYNEDKKLDIPPQVEQHIAQLNQQGEHLSQMLQQAAAHIKELEQELKSGMGKQQMTLQAQQKQKAMEAMLADQLAKRDAALKWQLAKLDADTKTGIAADNNATKHDLEEMKGLIQMLLAKMEPPEGLDGDGSTPIDEPDQTPDKHGELLEHIANLTKIMAAPKVLVRDEAGRPSGVQSVLPTEST